MALGMRMWGNTPIPVGSHISPDMTVICPRKWECTYRANVFLSLWQPWQYRQKDSIFLRALLGHISSSGIFYPWFYKWHLINFCVQFRQLITVSPSGLVKILSETPTLKSRARGTCQKHAIRSSIIHHTFQRNPGHTNWVTFRGMSSIWIDLSVNLRHPLYACIVRILSGENVLCGHMHWRRYLWMNEVEIPRQWQKFYEV